MEQLGASVKTAGELMAAGWPRGAGKPGPRWVVAVTRR